MEKLTKFFKDMFTADSGISSKRVSGFIGWLVCLGIVIYCTVAIVQAPLIAEMLFYCSTALLGLDSVTGIWKNIPQKLKNN